MHKHAFQRLSPASTRYRCACGVYGYRLGTRVLPMTCSLSSDGQRCSREAVQVTGDKNQNRCAGHAGRVAA